MTEIWILAIVQGIAEFLPISSSGHLVILGSAMGELAESPTVEIILHAGTLGSILVIYWGRIVDLLTRDRRVVPLLAIGTLPAAVFGILLKSQAQWILRDPVLAGCLLIVTGVMLIVLARIPKREGEYAKMSLADAFSIGCFQAFAVLPGISRSGSTILGGRLFGLGKEDAVTFSFLLAIPAILGATALATVDLVKDYQSGTPQPFSIPELLVGGTISFVVGLVALRWLIRWNRKEQLSYFAFWCIPFGILAVMLFSLGVW